MRGAERLRALLFLDRPLTVVLDDDLHDARLVVEDLGHGGLGLLQLVDHKLTPLNVTLKQQQKGTLH